MNQVLAADGRPAVEPNQMDRALTDLGVAVPAPPPLEPSVLRAAAVLFAIEPRNFIRGAAVQLVRRVGIGPGPGPSSAREECAGPLVETVDCCLDRRVDAGERGVNAYPQSVRRARAQGRGRPAGSIGASRRRRAQRRHGSVFAARRSRSLLLVGDG